MTAAALGYLGAFVATSRSLRGVTVTIAGLTATIVSADLAAWRTVDELLQQTPGLEVFGGDSEHLTHGARFAS